MVNQLNFGMQAGQAINENLRRQSDRGRLDSILDRSMENTSRMDELMIDAMGINDPKMQKTALSFIDQRQKQFEKAAKPSKAQEEFEKGRAKSVSDYVTKTLQDASEAEAMDFTFQEARGALAGEITEPGKMAVLKANPFFQRLFGLTPDEAKLSAVTKTMLGDTKGIFGSRPTEREIFVLLEQMLPSMGKSYEANIAGLEYLETINEFKKMRGQIVNELTQGGSVYVPNIESQVQKYLQPMAQNFLQQLREGKQNIPAFQTRQDIPGIPNSEGLAENVRGRQAAKQPKQKPPGQTLRERVRATRTQ